MVKYYFNMDKSQIEQARKVIRNLKEHPLCFSSKDDSEHSFGHFENKLNDVNILTINFQLGDKEPISIIKLVQSNKQFGNLAIEKAELPSSLKTKDENENLKFILENQILNTVMDSWKIFWQKKYLENKNGKKDFEIQIEKFSNNVRFVLFCVGWSINVAF